MRFCVIIASRTRYGEASTMRLMAEYTLPDACSKSLARQ